MLHNFSLSLLVAEEHYAAVAQWVNAQHLGARLVYFSTKPRPGETPKLFPDAVANKLSVKQQTPFKDWMTRELYERFMHVCCSDIDTFRREKRAITLTGQIKSATRHEKDDRRRLDDRSRYVMGFSNQKKIEALTKSSAAMAERIRTLQQEKDAASRANKALQSQGNALTELLRFTNFSDLDIQDAKRDCTICEERIAQLRQKEGCVLEALRERLKETESRKKRQEEKAGEASYAVRVLMDNLSNAKHEQSANDRRLQSETDFDRLAYPFLEKYRALWLGTTALTLDNSAGQERQYRNRMHSEQTKLQEGMNTLSTRIVGSLTAFMHDFPIETREIDNTMESLPEVHRMYEQLVRDDLPRYENDFKERLTSQVLNQIAIFQMTLKQEYDKVRKRIESINGSM